MEATGTRRNPGPRRSALLALGLFVAAAAIPAPARAQESQFDAISIRVDRSHSNSAGSQRFPNGRFVYSNGLIAGVVGDAYDLHSPFRIIGLPGWTHSVPYFIEAKGAPFSTDRDTAEREFRSRLRALLADRFQMVAHREMRALKSVTLLVDKNGPKVKPAEGGGSRGIRKVGNHWEFRGVPMGMVAMFISNQLNQQVENRTELSGLYDFDLEFVPEGATDMLAKPGGEGTAASGDTLVTALRRQLGLRMESKKLPDVEVLVIDRFERPEEN